ncbi:hypothetical protein CYMTET_25423 [Cymbomonas tetramitiformis]|uniref:Uncharacterized protein n=1 Tax=Cymbomonas tetramitiformis TaxID=36881 RepID=A0AAE0FTS3_9CHLO|nr:hypothetical protein CYMTET_25423 [Cymbomonas tetramitiformis]
MERVHFYDVLTFEQGVWNGTLKISSLTLFEVYIRESTIYSLRPDGGWTFTEDWSPYVKNGSEIVGKEGKLLHL